MIKPASTKKTLNPRRPKRNKKSTKGNRMDPHSWVWDNIEDIVDTHAGGYVVVVGGEGIVYSESDGRPGELTKKAKRRFPKRAIMFFRVPHSQDFICALSLR